MRAIETRFYGPTNTKGSRVVATDAEGNTITIPYPHELSGEAVHRLAAEVFCNKRLWDARTLIGAPTQKGYCFLVAI